MLLRGDQGCGLHNRHDRQNGHIRGQAAPWGELGDVNSIGSRSYSVPNKVDLVAALEVPFHKGILKVAKGLTLWPTLREELLNFRRKQNERTSHISFEHWLESDHDDLVLVAALVCWGTKSRGDGVHSR